jgi:hypothetical protein
MTSTTSSTYDFFLPICAKLWRDRIGYEPLIFFVGTPEEWSSGHRKVVLDEVSKENYPVEWVGHIEGIEDFTVATCMRQHGAALSWLDPSDLMAVGDVDLFPVSREFHSPHDTRKNELAIRHASNYGQNGKYPAYGPCMPVSTWREVMRLTVGDPIGSMLKTFQEFGLYEIVKLQKANPMKEDRLWFFDEITLSKRICESRFGSSFLPVEGAPGQRLCRTAWPGRVVASNYVDAHCPRPGWTYENWKKIKDLLKQIEPNYFPWLDRYLAAYRKSGPSVGDPFA